MRLSTHGNIGNIGTIMYSRLLAFAFSLFATLPAQAGVLDDVKASGELKVCIWPDYYGISFRNPRTGTLQGIDIDLSLALAKDLGVRLVHVETSFNTLIDDLIAGKCQIGMMGIGVTPERKQQLAFSLPYLRSDIYAITTRDNATLKTWADIDRPGRAIAVQKGTYMESLMRRTLAHARLIVTERPGEREREVSSGRADAFITDYPYSQRMLASTDWARRIEPTQTVQLTDYAYAVAQGDAPWLARVNQFVTRIKADGRLRSAAQRHQLTPIVVSE